MSDKELIVPSGIPQFIGNLGTLETDTKALTADAKLFRSSGAAVHSSFQGLSACYKAPEAEKLFATTKPVETKSDAFADDLEKVASALSSYASTVKPLATRLGNLKDEAIAFVSSIEGDDHWRRDQKKVDHNNNLWNSVNATVAAFHDAERACHDKIVALVNGTPLIPDDGTHKQNMYGYRASDLAHAEKTPWGSKANREYTGLAWLGHQVKSFVWDGFIVDGVWGTVKGLGTLVGTEGWDKAGQAWTGLGKLATGLVISASPLGTAFWTLPDDKLPRWVRDSRTTVKETGKALVAYDQWGKNPARAAGGVSFNVLTTVFTGGSGAAAKGGALARTASVLGKAGRIVDPMTYVGKAAKFGYVKVGDLMSGLKNLRAGSTFHLADEAFKIPGDAATSALPKRPAGLPEDVATFLDRNDKPVYMDKKTGALYDEHGKELQPAKDVKKELSAEERAAEATSHRPEARARQDDALVTAGVRNGGGEATASAGGHGGAGGHAPGGGAAPTPSAATGGHSAGGHGAGSDFQHAPHDHDSPKETHHSSVDSGDSGHGPAVDRPDSHHETPGDHTATADTDPAHTMRDYTPPHEDPKSKIPVPPKEHGDIVLSTGDHVYHEPNLTTIGYDTMTQLNRDLTARLEGYHDVVVHGNDKGFFMPGRKNAMGVDFPPGEVHATHIVEAIRNNPSYRGEPIRLISCHTGRVKEGISDIPAAQQVANDLGVPVMAPTDEVGIYPSRGKGQVPEVQNDGYWRTFLPMAR
ncbi:hypothetical protein [Streptomyces cinnamoneus]|uniref:Uncharacterized protein n=1 Tax=Streptomyces cinnamoneus TaxID=53446 RepID=A0A918U2G3_STRCJ|nr:hypothetical protein [Streptomyces cinnamoneus]GHC74441.1 hypothetical protein GCM10010507_62280 [Streptomyces cinnamoneus]